MHKKLAADLTSLAHSILQMKNKDDVLALKAKAHQVYEKLSILAYVEEYLNSTPNAKETKEEFITKIEEITKTQETKQTEVVIHSLEDDSEETPAAVEFSVEDELTGDEKESAPIQKEVAEIAEKDSEEDHENLPAERTEESKEEEISFENSKNTTPEESLNDIVNEIEEKAQEIIEDVSIQVEEEIKETVELINEDLSADSESEQAKDKVLSLDDELKDTIAVDVVADLFENATKKSLNDKLQGDIQIGLNDRIAFVKNLFDGSQEDFNRVVSQLNTFKTEKEAKKFINKMVKPDYDWTEKEEFEERFMAIVERKFA